MNASRSGRAGTRLGCVASERGKEKRRIEGATSTKQVVRKKERKAERQTASKHVVQPGGTRKDALTEAPPNELRKDPPPTPPWSPSTSCRLGTSCDSSRRAWEHRASADGDHESDCVLRTDARRCAVRGWQHSRVRARPTGRYEV